MSEASGGEPHVLPVVRAQVRDMLMRSPAYRQLNDEQRRDLAHNMVRVASYIAGGADGRTVPRAAALAGTTERPADPAGDTAGQRFGEAGAVAAKTGSQAFTDMISAVNFPQFVAGLIDGVFNAIVDASIRQMEAYAELVKNVAKSVDQYMKDNITENQARDYLAGRYPEHLEVDISGEQPVVKPREGADEESLPDFFKDLGLEAPLDSFDEETVEQQLVPAARRRMAMDRQQLLATMVLMGINRLIVTDGLIEASVKFDLDTRDSVKRSYDQSRASEYDRTNTTKRSRRGDGGFWGWFSPSTTTSETVTKFKVSTMEASSEDSEATARMKASLAGKVRVNFRSETFPLERMADVLQVNEIQSKSPAGRVPGTPTPTESQPAAGGQNRNRGR